MQRRPMKALPSSRVPRAEGEGLSVKSSDDRQQSTMNGLTNTRDIT